VRRRAANEREPPGRDSPFSLSAPAERIRSSPATLPFVVTALGGVVQAPRHGELLPDLRRRLTLNHWAAVRGSPLRGGVPGPGQRSPPFWRPRGPRMAPLPSTSVKRRCVARVGRCVERRRSGERLCTGRRRDTAAKLQTSPTGPTLHATARSMDRGAAASALPTTLPWAAREPRSLSAAMGGAAARLSLGRRSADRCAAPAPACRLARAPRTSAVGCGWCASALPRRHRHERRGQLVLRLQGHGGGTRGRAKAPSR
jgi:hypothetical protein